MLRVLDWTVEKCPMLGNAGRGDLQWLTLAVAIGCLLTLNVVLFVLPGATYTAMVPHDLFGYFDAMHRARHGQSPHVDFHTPIGWLSYGLPYLGYLALDQFGSALEFGNAAMLAILLPLAAVALYECALSSTPLRLSRGERLGEPCQHSIVYVQRIGLLHPTGDAYRTSPVNGSTRHQVHYEAQAVAYLDVVDVT